MRAAALLCALLAVGLGGAKAQEPYEEFEFTITRATPGRSTPEVMVVLSSADDPNLSIDLGALEISTVLGPIDPDTGYRLQAPNGVRYAPLNITRTLSPADVASGLTPLERWFEEVSACVTSKSCRDWPGAAAKNKGNGSHSKIEVQWKVEEADRRAGAWERTVKTRIKMVNIWPISYRRTPVTEGVQPREVVTFKVEGIEMSSVANTTEATEADITCAASFAKRQAQAGETMEGGGQWWGVLEGSTDEATAEELSKVSKKRVTKQGGDATLHTRVRELGNFASETIIAPSDVASKTRARFTPGREISYCAQGTVLHGSWRRVATDCDGFSDDGTMVRNLGDPIETWPPEGALSPDDMGVVTETYSSLSEQVIEGGLDDLAAVYGGWLKDLLTPSPFNPNEFGSMMGVVNEVLDRAVAAENPVFAPTSTAMVNVLSQMRQGAVGRGGQWCPHACDSTNALKSRAAPPPTPGTTFSVDSFFDIWYELAPPKADGSPSLSPLSAGGAPADACAPMSIDDLTRTSTASSSTATKDETAQLSESVARVRSSEVAAADASSVGARREEVISKSATVSDAGVSPLDKNACPANMPVKCWDGSCRASFASCAAPSETYEWDTWRAATFREVVTRLKNTDRWSRTIIEGKTYVRKFADGSSEKCQGDIETYLDSFPTAIELPKFEARDFGQAASGRRAAANSGSMLRARTASSMIRR